MDGGRCRIVVVSTDPRDLPERIVICVPRTDNIVRKLAFDESWYEKREHRTYARHGGSVASVRVYIRYTRPKSEKYDLSMVQQRATLMVLFYQTPQSVVSRTSCWGVKNRLMSHAPAGYEAVGRPQEAVSMIEALLDVLRFSGTSALCLRIRKSKSNNQKGHLHSKTTRRHQRRQSELPTRLPRPEQNQNPSCLVWSLQLHTLGE